MVAAVTDRPRQPQPPSEPARPLVDNKPTCWHCGRTLFEYAARPWSLRCKKCRAQNKSQDHG